MTAPEPTIPDEVVESVAQAMHGQEAGPGLWNEEPGWSKEVYRRHARAALAAAAPALLAANQPAPDTDLRETLKAVHARWAEQWVDGVWDGGSPDMRPPSLVDYMAPVVEVRIAQRVAAARAEALREAAEATETHYTISGGMGGAQKFTRTPREVSIFTGKQRDWLLAQAEAGRG